MKLPDPPRWKNPVATTALFITVVAGFGVWSGVWTAVYVSRGDLLTAAVTLTAAVAAFSMVLILLRTGLRKSVLADAISDSSATTLQPSFSLEVLSRTFGMTVAISCLLFAVCAPRDDLAFQLAGGRRIFLPIAIGAIGLGALFQLVRSGRAGHSAVVRLSPTELLLFNGYSNFSPAWVDISEVTGGVSQSRGRRVIVVTTKAGRSRTFNSASWLTPGGVALYWMIRHYWKHPEDRAELADGRAIERLRDERFDTAD